MASLLDVAAVPRTVEVNGINLPVYGVSAHGVASLMARFPAFGKFMSGTNPSSDELMKVGPEALAAFIAAGTGGLNDSKQEEIAATLGVGTQLEVVDMILKLTFPRGVGPFVQKLRDLGVMAQQGVREVSAMDSQEGSKSSSQQDTVTSGPTPQKQ
jgi:hypothetical protein